MVWVKWMSEEQEGVSEMKIDDLDDDDDDGDDVVEWWVEAVIMWPHCWHHWHCLAWHNCLAIGHTQF